MKKFFKRFQQDKITYWGFIISFMFLIGSYAILVLVYNNLPPFLPLYNKMPWGYERIGKKNEIFIYLGLATLFFITNLIVVSNVYRKAALLARFLGITTLIIWFFVIIYVAQIVLLMR